MKLPSPPAIASAIVLGSLLAAGLIAGNDSAPVQESAAGAISVPHRCRARARGTLPDPMCTPGAVLAVVSEPHVDLGATICRPGWAASQRPPLAVTEPLKRKLLRAYGYRDQRLSHYELDHLVPIELGGASSVSNLWPQPHRSSFRKDRLENALHAQVCEGTLSLLRAQVTMARDWRGARP